MYSRTCQAIAIGIGSLVMTASSAQAIPVSQDLRFHVHADPADPQSNIVLTIDLYLTSVGSDQNTIAWQVDLLTLTQPNLSGGGDTVWLDMSPSVSTPDGLWWVEHADPANPQISEFVLPPLVEGTGIEQNSESPGLIAYAFEGAVYVPPPTPETPPFTNTAAMDGVFWIGGQPAPDVVARSASVAMIDPIQNDPPGSGT